jgi:hypothetical protein
MEDMMMNPGAHYSHYMAIGAYVSIGWAVGVYVADTGGNLVKHLADKVWEVLKSKGAK